MHLLKILAMIYSLHVCIYTGRLCFRYHRLFRLTAFISMVSAAQRSNIHFEVLFLKRQNVPVIVLVIKILQITEVKYS